MDMVYVMAVARPINLQPLAMARVCAIKGLVVYTALNACQGFTGQIVNRATIATAQTMAYVSALGQ